MQCHTVDTWDDADFDHGTVANGFQLIGAHAIIECSSCHVGPDFEPIFDAEGQPSVVLVRQFRPPYARAIIEIPAGMRDVDGEPAEETGRRELVEEAGLRAGEMVHLIDMLPSPGMTDSVCSIFMATGCESVAHDRHGPEEESMELLHLPLDDALAMIDQGEIADAKSVCGLLTAHRRLSARS